MTSIPGIFRALNRARVRYVLIGGYASVVHGVPRTTVDVDLALDPGPENVRRAVRCLRASGCSQRGTGSTRSLVQWHRIPAFGVLGGHPADHEILAVDDEHAGGAAFDRRQVREGESDGHQGTWAQGDWDLPSHVVPDVVVGVSPQVLQGSSEARRSGPNSSFRIPRHPPFFAGRELPPMQGERPLYGGDPLTGGTSLVPQAFLAFWVAPTSRDART